MLSNSLSTKLLLFCFYVSIFLGITSVYAQSPSVQTKDLICVKEYILDTSQTTGYKPVYVEFKVSSLATLSKLTLNFSADENGASVLTKEFNAVTQDGITYFEADSHLYPVTLYNARLQFNLPLAQAEVINYATAVVVDQNLNQSSPVNCRIF